MSRAVLLAACAVACVFAVPAIAGASLGNDSFPGVALPASPVTSSLHFHPGAADHDRWDIYRVELAEGDELQLSLTMNPGGCYALDLYYADPVTGEPRPLLNDSWLRYPEVVSYAVPEGRAGTYYVVVNNGLGEPLDGVYSLVWSKTNDPVQRLWGNNRINTASAITRSTFPTSTAVVVANGMGYADALSASGLAGALRAPVVLATPTAYPEDYMRSAWPDGVTDVYLVGGTGVLTAEFEHYLAGQGYNVHRLAGESRYETAARVAQEVATITGATPKAFLVSGAGFADALAVSPIAYSQKMPILLSRPDVLSPPTATQLEAAGVSEVILVGGDSALGGDVKSAVESLSGGSVTATRWGSSSRFKTAVAVATAAEDRGWASADYVGLANGYGFADALAGSSWIGKHGGVLLLSGPATLDPDTALAISPSATKVSLFGGPAVLSNTVATGVSSRLR